jgi:FixJ family two-component response regulator
MDYKLPNGTGFDVAERIGSKGSEAPIILISGYDPIAVALRAEKLRISDIIEKPFSRAAICDAMKKAIRFSSNGEACDSHLRFQVTDREGLRIAAAGQSPAAEPAFCFSIFCAR